MTARKPPAPRPSPSRGRGLLGLAEDAHALLDAWRTQSPPGIGGDTRAVVRAYLAARDRAAAATTAEGVSLDERLAAMRAEDDAAEGLRRAAVAT